MEVSIEEVVTCSTTLEIKFSKANFFVYFIVYIIYSNLYTNFLLLTKDTFIITNPSTILPLLEDTAKTDWLGVDKILFSTFHFSVQSDYDNNVINYDLNLGIWSCL